jgi:hypothetical protein
MGWTPDVFWRSTPHEFYAAVTAYNRSQGGDAKGSEEDEFAEFKASLSAGGVKVD